MDLSNAEIRVLGCLLEKQRTTPEHYPLSLNSLRLACNQSTNRDPVVQYDEAILRDALHRLGRRGYARLAGAGRAAKYRHLLADALPMSSAEQALMCVLMLRGPQTPGELKQRGERIHAFADLSEVGVTLDGLIERRLVVRLERRPGQKEERYAQLLGGESPADGSPAERTANGSVVRPEPDERDADERYVDGQDVDGRDADGRDAGNLDDLRDRIERLEREVAELREVIQS